MIRPSHVSDESVVLPSLQSSTTLLFPTLVNQLLTNGNSAGGLVGSGGRGLRFGVDVVDVTIDGIDRNTYGRRSV